MSVFANIFLSYFSFVLFAVVMLLVKFFFRKLNVSKVIKNIETTIQKTLTVLRFTKIFTFFIVRYWMCKWTRFVEQKLNRYRCEAKRVGRFHVLDYWIEGQAYTLLVSFPDKPWLFTVVDQDGRDQTLVVGKYLGPNVDCHGSAITPFDLGFESLTILCLGCDPLEKQFSANEILVIDKKLKSDLGAF